MEPIMTKKFFLTVLSLLIFSFYFVPVMVLANEDTFDIFSDGKHITQADVDMIYAYEKLMREYMSKENTNKISDEKYKAIITQAGFASDDYFDYVLYRIMMLHGFIKFQYNLQEAEEARIFAENVIGGKIIIDNSALAEMGKKRLGPPEPSEAEIKLILANWERLPRAIYLTD